MSALVVNFNSEAASSVLNLDSTSAALSNAISELSSGLAVQYSSQGPASWAISNLLQFQSSGLTSATSNAQQGTAVLNIASGATNQIAGILDQMEQLAVQNANGGAMTTSQLQANNTQYQSLLTEINDIVSNTTYGAQSLLSGGYSNETFQIGFQSVNTFTVTLSSLNATGLTISGTGISTSASGASAVISTLENSLSTLGSVGASIGSAQDELSSFVQDLDTTNTNVMSANSSLVDANMASEMTTFTTDQILLQSGLSMLGQAQANPTLVLKLL